MPNGVDVLKEKLQFIPHRPGVYRMLSGSGQVLYVGKAKDLKKRITSYTKFEKLPVRLQQMVSQIADVVIVETDNEAEAILLENELIKKYRPYYNILLKDDKSFPYLFFSSDDFPRVSKYRGSRREKGTYFGPYANSDSINTALDVLQKVFLLRTCRDSVFKNRERPCLLYQIKRCSAPCVGLVTKEDYANSVKSAKDFMNGKETNIQKEMTALMLKKSEEQAYEEALVLRNRISALNQLSVSVDGTLNKSLDADFIAVFKQGNDACVQVFFFRKGHNGGTHAVFFKDVADNDEKEILENFFGQFYRNIPLPHELIVSHVPSDKEQLEEALSQRAGMPVIIKTNVKEGRKRLLERAVLNAKEALDRHLVAEGLEQKSFDDLADLMGLEKIEKIEVYDNSHIQGTASVGAMIVATPQGFDKKQYRRFNIAQAQTNDDFAMMKEVLTRRLKREENLPDLMLIDGGKGQISAVCEIMREMNCCVPVLGVAKGKDRNAGREKLWKADAENPIELDTKSSLQFFIQRLRDEAHRFAVDSHRIRRSKEQREHPLDEIEGIGARRRRLLLQHFGTIKAVFEASESQLAQVEGISLNLAKKIYTFTHKSV
ncbi:MAG: excinuclease ABC subunit UvrC [Alphaproteobacteria bacterium]|nr:excinuclease ABC subunit UvrC [Alphaproteobacteria bacterium]